MQEEINETSLSSIVMIYWIDVHSFPVYFNIPCLSKSTHEVQEKKRRRNEKIN